MDSADFSITGFALLPDGRLLVRRGYGSSKLHRENAAALPADDFKRLLWLVELAIKLQFNDLAHIGPEAIGSFLKAIAACHPSRPDPITGAVLRFILPDPIHVPAEPDESPRGSVCQPVVGLFPGFALRARTHPAGVGRLGDLAETGASAVA